MSNQVLLTVSGTIPADLPERIASRDRTDRQRSHHGDAQREQSRTRAA